MSVPANRHQRRAAIATGSQVPMIADPRGPVVPNYTMRVLVIDGTKRMIGERVIRAGPEHFTALLGKRALSWAKIGEVDDRVHIMLAGDNSPQEHAPDHRWFEGEFEVLNAEGEASPILHGRAAVFGFMPALNKAGSTPVTPLWLQERVRWLDRGAAAALEGQNEQAPLAIEHQARLEDQSGQVEGSEEP